MGKAGAKIIAALQDAVAGKFARVTIEGQTWVPETPLHRAAPDLLEALKIARECITYCRKAHVDAQSGSGIPVEMILDAAIAKATGGA